MVLLVMGVSYQGLALLRQKSETLTQAKATKASLEQRQAALTRAERDIKTYSELETISKAIVPQEKDQARTVRELTAIAQQTGISIGSIQFPESALGEAKKKSKSSKKKKQALVDPNTTQLVEVEGTKGLYAMQVTVQSDNAQPVVYNRLLSFLEQLEKNRRTAHVTNLSIQPENENRNLVTFTITLNVYIKLES